MKNISPQKTYFFPLVTSRTYSIRLTANRKAQIDGGYPGLSFGSLTILLATGFFIRTVNYKVAIKRL